MSTVDVRGLTFGYGDEPVLRDLDLHQEGGGLLAVLGPSGCGKTTLLRLLAGFERPDAGSIDLGGTCVAGPDGTLPPNARRIGFVPQEGALFPHLDVAANIGFALPRRHPGRRRRVEELLEVIGLAGLGSRQPRELSGGQQQRVALARALAARPQLVLLDEPFASLDPDTRRSLRDSVREILLAEGATALLVTHDREEALSTADRVAVLLDGRVAQVGDPHAVYDAPVDTRVARLLGEVNLLPVTRRDGGTAHSALGGLPVGSGTGDEVLVRPEQMRLTSEGIPAVVVRSSFAGETTRVQVEIADGRRLLATLVGARPVVGERVHLAVRGPVHLIERWGDRPRPSEGDLPTRVA